MADNDPMTLSIEVRRAPGEPDLRATQRLKAEQELDEPIPDIATFSPASVLALLPTAGPARNRTDIMSIVPSSMRWRRGRRDRPWGLGDDYLPRRSRPVLDLETVAMGKGSWFFRADGQRSYDTLREAFVGERLNGGRDCGCVSAHGFGSAAVDCEAQLEFMRSVMRRILFEMPDLGLDAMCDDLFGGQRQLCEHYLWWLENESFVAHPAGAERQDRLMLTDEGCAALAMLELTRPGSNADMSPQTLHGMRQRAGRLEDLDRPLFLPAG